MDAVRQLETDAADPEVPIAEPSDDDGAQGAGAAFANARLPETVVMLQGSVDASVLADVERLAGGRPYALLGGDGLAERVAPDRTKQIVIEYRGKGKLHQGPPVPAEEPADGIGGPAEEHAWTEMIGVNAATSNEFSLSIPKGVDYAPMLPDQDPAHATKQADAVADGSGVPGASPLIAAVPDDPGTERSWSNNDDDRTQRLSNNQATAGVFRWLLNLSNTCTGFLVGDRQFLTAGHCAYNRATQAWVMNGVIGWIGRNGTSWVSGPWGEQVNMNGSLVNSNDPQDGLWFWVDANYIGSTPTGYDFAVITVPKSERWDAAVSFNGQRYFASHVVSDATLQGMELYVRGYPACDSEGLTFNGQARLDEPCQGAAGQGYEKT